MTAARCAPPPSFTSPPSGSRSPSFSQQLGKIQANLVTRRPNQRTAPTHAEDALYDKVVVLLECRLVSFGEGGREFFVCVLLVPCQGLGGEVEASGRGDVRAGVGCGWNGFGREETQDDTGQSGAAGNSLKPRDRRLRWLLSQGTVESCPRHATLKAKPVRAQAPCGRPSESPLTARATSVPRSQSSSSLPFRSRRAFPKCLTCLA